MDILSLFLLIPGPASLYCFWFFYRNPMFKYSNGEITIFKAFQSNDIFPCDQIKTIRNINNIRYQIQLIDGRRRILVINSKIAQQLHELSGIPLEPIPQHA